MIRWSSQEIPIDDQREKYLGSFVVATQGEIEEDMPNSPIFNQNTIVAPNLGSGGTLASIIEPERPKEYDLVTPPIRKSCALANQCVYFVQGLMNRKFNANAKDIPVNEDQPCEDCAVVFKKSATSPYGHVAYITEVTSPSFEIIEQNHSDCGIIETRSINFEEIKNIKGYVR